MMHGTTNIKFMYFYCYVYVLLLYVYVSSSCQLALFGYPDWDFSAFFLNCKASARLKPADTGHGPHYSKILCCLCIICFVSFCVLCVLYCTIATGWLPNCSWQIYHIIWTYPRQLLLSIGAEPSTKPIHFSKVFSVDFESSVACCDVFTACHTSTFLAVLSPQRHSDLKIPFVSAE